LKVVINKTGIRHIDRAVLPGRDERRNKQEKQ